MPMQLIPELFAGLGAALAVVVMLLFIRARMKRGRKAEGPMSRGPASLRFICAGCSEQFSHTRRTLGAWEKGTRRSYCNACHTKWRVSRPLRLVQGGGRSITGAPPTTGRRGELALQASVGNTSRGRPQGDRAGSGAGCLGLVVILINVPVAIAFAVVQYA
jgi:hypothetical protein